MYSVLINDVGYENVPPLTLLNAEGLTTNTTRICITGGLNAHILVTNKS